MGHDPRTEEDVVTRTPGPSFKEQKAQEVLIEHSWPQLISGVSFSQLSKQAEWAAKVFLQDPLAKLDQSRPLEVYHLHCQKWIKIPQPYNFSAFDEHCDKNRCAIQVATKTPLLSAFGFVKTSKKTPNPEPLIIVPCMGLSSDAHDRLWAPKLCYRGGLCIWQISPTMDIYKDWLPQLLPRGRQSQGYPSWYSVWGKSFLRLYDYIQSGLEIAGSHDPLGYVVQSVTTSHIHAQTFSRSVIECTATDHMIFSHYIYISFYGNLFPLAWILYVTLLRLVLSDSDTGDWGDSL